MEGARWLRQAEHELLGVKLLLEGGQWSQACRLSHAVAELSLKALAYYRGDKKPWGHSLDVLLQDVEDAFPELVVLSSDADRLNDYRTATIYPNTFSDSSPFEEYDEEEATAALRGAERIFTVARENIPAVAE